MLNQEHLASVGVELTVSGDSHRLQLPYDHNHDGSLIWKRLEWEFQNF